MLQLGLAVEIDALQLGRGDGAGVAELVDRQVFVVIDDDVPSEARDAALKGAREITGRHRKLSTAARSAVYEAPRCYVLAADKVRADGTPLPVLALGEGRTKTARLWPHVREDRLAGSNDPPAVWFAYSPNRQGEHLQRHLRTFAGILQAVDSPGAVRPVLP